MPLRLPWFNIRSLKAPAEVTEDIGSERGFWKPWAVVFLLRDPGDLVSRVVSTVNRVTQIITLLITCLLSPLGLQVYCV